MRTTLIIILCIALACAVLFVATNRSHPQEGETSPNDQASYAEVSTTSPQGLPAATSTTKISLPVIVYHIVRPSYRSDSGAVRTLALTPETFDAEMDYLGTAGYHIVQFSDLEKYFENGTPLPSDPVILSFDDGWSDQFTYAFPVLEKYHYTATFFVFTNAIGRPGFLSWDNLKTLVATGMTIGSHSESHPYLTHITDPTKLWNEVNGSKQILQDHLGITVNEFAYPFGMYNSPIIALIQKAGYKSARGDFFSGEQTANRLYTLSAMNAPTTTVLFERRFPIRASS
jgi:peptidoglycan/xylan/chitin deacetylase (PgdA/CDA1 family)